MNVRVNDIAYAVEVYYSCLELTNKEIRKLFNVTSESSVWKLKELARKEMAEQKAKTFNPRSVDTMCAFKAWGLDIDDLERRYKRLKKLGMLKTAEADSQIEG